MTESVSQLPPEYGSLLLAVKERVRTAYYQALKAVNKELVGLYWDIGRLIVERQAAETWGKAIVQQLARDLQGEFPGISGFSVQNLWYMRQLYLEYQGSEKLQLLVGEIAQRKSPNCWRRSNDAQNTFTWREGEFTAKRRWRIIQRLFVCRFVFRLLTHTTAFGLHFQRKLWVCLCDLALQSNGVLRTIHPWIVQSFRQMDRLFNFVTIEGLSLQSLC
jgi:sulfur relay (sulfurtransferase) DsrC/TusE family protein